MKKRTIGIILIILSIVFFLSFANSIFTSREKNLQRIKAGFELQKIELSDDELNRVLDTTQNARYFGGGVLLIISLGLGYKGYKLYKFEANKE